MAALAEGRAAAAAAAVAVAAAVAAAAAVAVAGAAAAAAVGAAAAAAAAAAAPVDGGDGDATEQTLVTQKCLAGLDPTAVTRLAAGRLPSKAKASRAGGLESLSQLGRTPRGPTAPWGLDPNPVGRGGYSGSYLFLLSPRMPFLLQFWCHFCKEKRGQSKC